MEAKYVEQMSQMTKSMMESMTQFQEINARTVQTLAKQQMAAAEEFMKAGADGVKDLTQSKDLQEVVSKQVAMATQVGEMMKAKAEQTMEVLTNAKTELDALVEKNLEILKSASQV